jgi:hypothetical protein
MYVSPTQSNVQAGLSAFLAAVLPGRPNQQPAVFVGSIAGTTLTVVPLPTKQPSGIQGAIVANAPLLGLGVTPGTTIVGQLSGTTGGIGSYQVSIAPSVASATMATGVAIVLGQQNRVAEPANPYFAIMTPISFVRLATNLDATQTSIFTGSVSGSTLTVASVLSGAILIGAAVNGTALGSGAIATQVVGLGTGVGGTGTYVVSPAASGSGAMFASAKTLTQSARVVVQVDFHSPDSIAGDLAQTVSTALRDEYGTTFFAGLNPPLNGISPLHADDPRQVPFINDSNQYEWRWSLDVHLQVQQAVSVPVEYATSATVRLIDVDAVYPPR